MKKEYDEFDQEAYFEEARKQFNQSEKEFQEAINKKLIISLYGDVNSGKSNTINALLGQKLAEVGGTAGLTKGVTLYKFNEHVFVADTPGLDDINEENSKRAMDFVEEDSDIILFFFTASEGAKRSKVEALKNLRQVNRQILVVLNKIDIWYEAGELEDKEAFVAVKSQIEKETGEKVIPISAKKKININILDSEIVSVLEKHGKDLLYLKVSKRNETKEKSVSNFINIAAASAFAIGAIPLPGADIIPLTSLQIGLAIKIGYIYGYNVTEDDILSLMALTITGTAGKQLFKLAIQALKALGWLGGPFTAVIIAAAAATIAASITYGFGWACNAYFKSGMKLDGPELSEIYKDKFGEYKKLSDNNKKK